MPNIPGSVPIGGFIAPYAATDTYATQDSIYGRGGLREVATYVDRNAITADRRRPGMLVCVQADATYWRLLPGPWTYTNTDWVAFNTGGGGGGTYLFPQPTPSSVWTINHPLNGYPSVVVLDGGTTLVEGSIQYVTTSQIVITFDTPISGLAQLN
jgi:hypothetical protein